MTAAIFVQAMPWDYTAGAAVTLRATNTDIRECVFTGGVEYLPVVDGGPVFSTTAFTGIFSGASSSARGSLPLVAGEGDIDTWAQYAWPSRPVKIWKATLDYSDDINPVLGPLVLIFDGVAESYDPDEATIFLNTTRPVGLLAAATYAGTGVLEGAASLKGVRKPFSIGRQVNRAPILLDPSKLIFQVNGAGKTTAFNAFRERGAFLDQVQFAASSFTAMAAAVVPPSKIFTHLATGTFRLGFQPAGDITVDYDGTITGGTFPTDLGALVRCILKQSGWSDAKINDASLATIGAAFPFIGQFHDESGTDVADALTSTMLGAGGYWDVDELGVFYAGLMQQVGTPDFAVGDEGSGDFDILDLDLLPTRAMFWKNRVAYAFNPSVKTFDETQPSAVPDMTTFAPVELAASVAGVLNTGQLPLIQSYRRTAGGVDVSPTTTFAITVTPTGGATVTVNNTAADPKRGDVTVTAMSAIQVTILVTSTYNGLPIYRTSVLKKVVAAPPAGGGGSTGGTGTPGPVASANSFTPPFGSTSHIVMATLPAVTVGTAGSVVLTAPLAFSVESEGDVDPGFSSPTDAYMYAKWRFSTNAGSSYTDVAAEVIAPNPATCFNRVDTENGFTGGFYGYKNNPGNLGPAVTKSGLTSGASVIFQLMGRSQTTRQVISVSGTAAATPQ